MKLILFLAGVSIAFGQNPNPVTDGLTRGILLRQQIERTRIQREELELERARQNRLQQAQEFDQKMSRLTDQNSAIKSIVNGCPLDLDSVSKLQAMYPDFLEQGKIIAVLCEAFPTNLTKIGRVEYLESMYVIAKHASFVQKAREAAQQKELEKP